MKITLDGIGKRFNNREWIIRDFNYIFEPNKSYAITGSNGSGKSTLVKMISGILPATKGQFIYENEGKPQDVEGFYKYLSYAAPYLDLVEEFTLDEMLRFHFKFKKITPGYQIGDLIEKMYLENSRNKHVGDFSSGMKQRLKLGLALFSQASVTILDEPTSNMDERGSEWYSEQIKEVVANRMLIVASNQASEYTFVDNTINLNA
ncbi:MAG: ATP-binding cassette domain-containing protein [Cyclobacteriaceae bacterium]